MSERPTVNEAAPAVEVPPASSISQRSQVLLMFKTFHQILDEHNDRFERLVKLSRDLTIQSKRIIFLLHRLALGKTPPPAEPAPVADSIPRTPYWSTTAPSQTSDVDANSGGHDADPGTKAEVETELIGKPDPGRAAELEAAAEARQKFDTLKPLFEKIAAELEGHEAERYAKAISPGLQEFLEALSFTHYLENGTLITYPEVLKLLDPIPLRIEDYLLGVSDVSGELMRFAISVASQLGRRHKVAEICHFVRRFSASWEPLTPYIRGLANKQRVTNQSLKKIENAAYAIAIRRMEYADIELQEILLDFTRDQDDGRRQSGEEMRNEY